MRCGRRRAGVGARGIVVPPAAGVRESVIGIVYLLEFLGTGWTGGVVVCYTVGVILEGCSWRTLAGRVGGLWERGRRGVPFIGLADLSLVCGGGNPKGCIWSGVRSGGKRSGQKKAYNNRPKLFQRKLAGPKPYYSVNGGHTRSHDCRQSDGDW